MRTRSSTNLDGARGGGGHKGISSIQKIDRLGVRLLFPTDDILDEERVAVANKLYLVDELHGHHLVMLSPMPAGQCIMAKVGLILHK